MPLKQPLGVTFIVPDGQEATGIYEDENGVAVFETDIPYLLDDGVSLQPPLPVKVVSGPIFTDSMGNAQKALAVTGMTMLPFASDIAYWFDAGKDAFSDVAGTTPATDGDTVALWGNQGSQENAVQNTALNRPTFKTGGLNGRPYIECMAANAQYFEDLLGIPQPTGASALNLRSYAFVTDNVTGLSNSPSLLGSTQNNGGKAGLYFRSTANAQVRAGQNAWSFGNIANPQAGALSMFDATNMRWNINGTKGNIASAMNASGDSSIATVEFLRSTNFTANGYFNGKLYELIIWDRKLTDSSSTSPGLSEIDENLAIVTAYLKAKYGIA